VKWGRASASAGNKSNHGLGSRNVPYCTISNAGGSRGSSCICGVAWLYDKLATPATVSSSFYFNEPWRSEGVKTVKVGCDPGRVRQPLIVVIPGRPRSVTAGVVKGQKNLWHLRRRAQINVYRAVKRRSTSSPHCSDMKVLSE